MAGLFGQLMLMAAPIKAVLGPDYSPEKVAGQVETLVVVARGGGQPVDWGRVHRDLVATPVVPGLEEVTVPSLGQFTEVVRNIATYAEGVR